ncbi:MAG: glutamate-1-semialdehyde-2,1-aminomutase [Firmicutes bacterium HGW-Firmicutes-3]|jgi:glutamate-1-semialdehyde 2,1-aminomutase|nr:MAG: glutamate-1-semialdehyde-2,1-aminomutase [Firmicutes bacterium HGW-Firmicutes-3]
MKNKELFEAAKKVMPGGVNSPVRSFSSVATPPIFAKRALGAMIWDVEDKPYIDFIGGFGPHILGHANPVVLEGVVGVLSEGISFGLSTAIEVEMAKTINRLMPSMEMIRMVNSGTEATMSAIRLARGFTKRKKILKFEGCYHGHSDSLLIKSGSGGLSFNVPTSAGVLDAFIEHTLVGQVNDIKGLEALWAKYGQELAGVIVEPVAANMGIVPLEQAFLERLRDLATSTKTVLIFDEVITGFRLGLGGAQGYFKIQPDLTCLGKIIGGGMPVGAYGGRADIMAHISPLGDVYQAGTLSGNRVAMAMGLNTLNYLEKHPMIYNSLEEKAIFLEKAMNDNLTAAGIEGQVNRVGSLLSLFFTKEPVTDYQSVMKSDTELFGRYFTKMIEAGILLAPSTFEAMFLSMAHDEVLLKTFVDIQKEVLKSL